jgi:hypothetical protein
MSTFEDNLWDELVREHHAERAHPGRAINGRPARRRLLAGTSLGLAGAGTAVALALTAGTAAPAFAVTSNANGTVTVTINQIAGISGANSELAALGVSARAVPIVQGCTAILQPLPKGTAPGAVLPAPNMQSFTITPSAIPTGDTVVLAAQLLSGGAVQTTDALVQGAAPACVAQAVPTKKALP